jgi:hypothetical protein
MTNAFRFEILGKLAEAVQKDEPMMDEGARA